MHIFDPMVALHSFLLLVRLRTFFRLLELSNTEFEFSFITLAGTV
jgi:hypothetical protein